MEYKFEVGDELFYDNGDMVCRCRIIKQWDLLFMNKYPTYKVKLLDNIENAYWDTFIASEDKLTESRPGKKVTI